jgi:hypothetical protein
MSSPDQKGAHQAPPRRLGALGVARLSLLGAYSGGTASELATIATQKAAERGSSNAGLGIPLRF